MFELRCIVVFNGEVLCGRVCGDDVVGEMV